MSPALAGRFLSTVPPGKKSCHDLLYPNYRELRQFKSIGLFFFFFALFCLNLSISFGFIYNLRAINTKNLCLVLMFVYVSVTKNNLSQCLKYVKDIFFNLPFKEILSLKIKKCYATLSCFSIYSSHLSQKLFLCCFIITLVLMLWQVTIFDEELNSDS